MKTLKNALLLLCIFSASLACQKENNQNIDCDRGPEGSPITQVKGPDKATVNEKITIDVSYLVFDNCGKFLTFSEQTKNNTRLISTQITYSGCDCDEKIIVRNQPYHFKAKKPGVYILKFLGTNLEYIEHVVEVITL